MSFTKHATLALALLAGGALGVQSQAQAQTGGTMGGGSSGAPAVGSTSPGTAAGAMPPSGGAPTSPGRAGHNDDSLARTGGGTGMGTTGRGNPMPNNSELGTGPAGPSVAGRSTGPGNTSTQTR